MIRRQARNAVLGGWADVDPIKAAAADITHGLVAVGFGVPRVATVFLLPKSLPYVTHTGRETHLGHLEQDKEPLHSTPGDPPGLLDTSDHLPPGLSGWCLLRTGR